ncbi:MAG: hypothetical protein PHV02_18710, partial [Rhodocyclaceae bacterium]|nr:hypothetical protein [Rhodocyclaceae bacterium]
MPIPWLTVLSNVPWKEVINNAPKVAEGAKKLWKAVGKKSAVADEDIANTEPVAAAENQTIATLDARIHGLQADVAALNKAMLSSSELIKALAEQNTQLIRSIEIFRGRVLRLG